ITGEHNDGIVRTPYLHKQFSKQVLDLFNDIKTAFDPHVLFNPGKKVNGSIEVIKKYLVKE
ncbi:MAG TPA: FAD-linked oxidase C-terminal domain-containing protein, partial [Candidatus Paceibacterota bacterium]|nr:FAD-linked oxidase C-terminal domain-containing protein [Candidatus Paceibacterota bacterium]